MVLTLDRDLEIIIGPVWIINCWVLHKWFFKKAELKEPIYAKSSILCRFFHENGRSFENFQEPSTLLVF